MTVFDQVFEWHNGKARANVGKHGVSFARACAIWDDPRMFSVKVAEEPEPRWLCVGRVGKGEYLSAIVTFRGDVARIISARKATKMEVRKYHE